MKDTRKLFFPTSEEAESENSVRKVPSERRPWWMCGRAHAFYSRRGPTRNLNTELEVLEKSGAIPRVHSTVFPTHYLFPTRLLDNKDKSMSAKLAKFGRLQFRRTRPVHSKWSSCSNCVAVNVPKTDFRNAPNMSHVNGVPAILCRDVRTSAHFVDSICVWLIEVWIVIRSNWVYKYVVRFLYEVSCVLIQWSIYVIRVRKLMRELIAIYTMVVGFSVLKVIYIIPSFLA